MGGFWGPDIYLAATALYSMSQNKNIAGSQPKGVDPFVVRLYILFQFFFNLLVWVPVFYEFQKRAGLTDPQIFRIQSIYYLAFCFLEIPTGWFADRFGYRTSVRWGAAVLVLANVIPPLLPTFGGFLGHFLLFLN